VHPSTDGWTTCALGHRHWGRAGAAGLLLHRAGPAGEEVLLQHRAVWSHHGGTWGTPGGALHAGEAADVGALREVREELGLLPDDVVDRAQAEVYAVSERRAGALEDHVVEWPGKPPRVRRPKDDELPEDLKETA